MAYRIVEITKPAECHVQSHQLVVEQEEGTVQIPLIKTVSPELPISEGDTP